MTQGEEVMAVLAASEKAFIELFNTVEDPREDGRVLYPLSEVLLLAVVAVLCCAESWSEIVGFGEDHIEFLRKYLPFEKGIPSKSVLSRVFGLIENKKMEKFLMDFTAWFTKHQSLQKEIVALDGKRIKGSKVHMLHVFATRLGIVLAQVNIENKINESIAVPEILEDLDIKGSVITTDALNYQKAIAEKARTKQADYFLALKENQGMLLEDVKSYFIDRKGLDYYEEADKGHSRVELRRCWSTDKIQWLKEGHSAWKDLKSVSCIERERQIRGDTQRETVFYISSTSASARNHLLYSREHWVIENKLHWVLDVVFNEDSSTLDPRNAAQNMAVVRKLVINMIRRYKAATGDKIAIKTARKAASWSKTRASKILEFVTVS